MLSSIQYAFLGHLQVNLRVTLSTHTHVVLYVVKVSKLQYDRDLCRIKFCGLQELRPPLLSQRLL